MKNYIKTIVLFLSISACTENPTTMKTPKKPIEQFVEFIAKKKFIEENDYPGIADERMRPIFTKKINRIASDF